MRFLHTSDWQFGMFRNFIGSSNKDAQALYSASRRNAVASIRKIALDVGAEFIVVSGDIFDNNQLSSREISLSLEVMRYIGFKLYLLPGNHDPLEVLSIYTNDLFLSECPNNVIVLRQSGIYNVRPGVQIVAAPWKSKVPNFDLIRNAITGLTANGTIRIVVGHGRIDLLNPLINDDFSLIKISFIEKALNSGAIHYVALGDRHSCTKVGKTGRIWYSGSPEVTNYNDIESNSGNVLIVDINEKEPQHNLRVKSKRVGKWKFITLCHNLDTEQDIINLDSAMAFFSNKEYTIIRLSLQGTLSIKNKVKLDDCIEKYKRLFGALNIWERNTNITVALSVTEFNNLNTIRFISIALKKLVLMSHSKITSEAYDAQNALGLFLRLSKRKYVE